MKSAKFLNIEEEKLRGEIATAFHKFMISTYIKVGNPGLSVWSDMSSFLAALLHDHRMQKRAGFQEMKPETVDTTTVKVVKTRRKHV